MSHFRITVMADNTVTARSARGEHGLCFHIESGNRRILFDSGQGLVLADNAQALGIDLGVVDTIALSHGHYDHTGGLPTVLSAGQALVSVHLHPDALQPKFNKTRPIGIPPASRVALNRSNVRLISSRDFQEIAPGLFLTGEVPRPHPEEPLAEVFHLDPHGNNPDPLLDDQSLFFDTPQGTVILLGCAHAGVIHILEHVQTLTNNRPIHAILGGMHLGTATPSRMQWVIEHLRRIVPRILVPMHCTGPRATAALWTAFPDACRPGGTGSIYEF